MKITMIKQLKGKICVQTGLHIGDATETMEIGGVDNPILRNSNNNETYIPGSSLKGKLRSLSEKLQNAPQNKTLKSGEAEYDEKGLVKMHAAEDEAQYNRYAVNPLFGLPGDVGSWLTAPTRLVVRDTPLSPRSAEELLKARTDLPYTEVKWGPSVASPTIWNSLIPPNKLTSPARKRA